MIADIRSKLKASVSERNRNDYQWYKDIADIISNKNMDAKKILNFRGNYNLYNDIFNPDDFKQILKPYGSDDNDLSSLMKNRDIVSNKIKLLLGMDKRRSFSWSVICTNKDAVDEKEDAKYNMIKSIIIDGMNSVNRGNDPNVVASKISGNMPIDDNSNTNNSSINNIVNEANNISSGKDIDNNSDNSVSEVNHSINDVNKYISRDYKSNIEIMGQDLLDYLYKSLNISIVFSSAFEHGLLTGMEVVYVGIMNKEPVVWSINPMDFVCNLHDNTMNIEDKEWAKCTYYMNITDILKYFGDELTDDNISLLTDKYNYSNDLKNAKNVDLFAESNFMGFDNNGIAIYKDGIEVVHCVWKGLRKIGIIEGDNGKEIVSEEYNGIYKDNVKWKWVPEVYETWKIKCGNPIYVKKNPIPGHFDDIDKLYDCKLPYKGLIYGDVNSNGISLMDRLKSFQYFYNLIMFKLDMLIASDKGKKIMIDRSNISKNLSAKEFSYLFERTSFMFYDKNDESSGGGLSSPSDVAQVIDLSLQSDIKKYMELGEYVRLQAGDSVGITKNMEGQVSPYETVRGNEIGIQQSSTLLETYFEVHNNVKANVLQNLLDVARYCYSKEKPLKINYLLDDLSRKSLNISSDILKNSTYGVFVSNSTDLENTKEAIKQLGHAALQNNAINISDIVKLLRTNSLSESEEILKKAELDASDKAKNMEQMKNKHMSDMQNREMQMKIFDLNNQKEIIKLKGKEDRKTEIVKGSMMGASYNPDTDKNNNGINDYLEMVQKQIGIDSVFNKQELEKEKFKQKKSVDERKLKQGDESLNLRKKELIARNKDRNTKIDNSKNKN